MYYVMDVVKTENKLTYQDSWMKNTKEFLGIGGLEFAQLFEHKRDIRNADYQFVSIQAWNNEDKYESSVANNRIFDNFDNIKIERGYYELEIQIGNPIDVESCHSWLVNPFEISKEQVPEVLEMWNNAKEYMVKKEGFISARLFKSIQKDDKYNLINIAQWQSAELFMQALNDTQYDNHRNRSLNYKLHPSLCDLYQEMYMKKDNYKLLA